MTVRPEFNFTDRKHSQESDLTSNSAVKGRTILMHTRLHPPKVYQIKLIRLVNYKRAIGMSLNDTWDKYLLKSADRLNMHNHIHRYPNGPLGSPIIMASRF